jgi:hypothetical protein
MGTLCYNTIREPLAYWRGGYLLSVEDPVEKCRRMLTNARIVAMNLKFLSE